MQIGYMRVSKADGSQNTDLQRDALRAAGVASRRLYEDRATYATSSTSFTTSVPVVSVSRC
jgi:DNA invertase Pin-like site-specific DNA recombinase